MNKVLLKNLFWSFSQDGLSQIIGLAATLFFTRLLEPKDFGLLGLIYVIFTIGNVLIDSGFSISLIRNHYANNTDFSTVYYFNIFFGVICYLVLVLTAGSIAEFFNQPELKLLLYIYGLQLIISACITSQKAFMVKHLKFKSLALIAIFSLIIGNGIGIYLAYKGYSYWSLVYATLVNLIVYAVLINIFSGFFPKIKLVDFDKLKEHYSFGYKLMLNNLLDAFSRNLINVLMGKFYSINDVGFYNRSETIKHAVVYTFNTALSKVTMPYLSKIQQEQEQFITHTQKIYQAILLFYFPLIFVLVLNADNLIIFLFTDRWISVVPYFQIVLFASIFFPISSFNGQLITILGKSNIVLKMGFISKLFLIFMVVIALPFGALTMVFMLLFYSILELSISFYFLKKQLHFNIKDLLKDIFISVLINIFVFFLLFFSFDYYNLLGFFALLLSAFLYFTLFFTLNFLLKTKAFALFIELKTFIK